MLGTVPRKRVPRQATLQFIGMLRALDQVVISHGVSHAQVERRLCEWLAEGHKAEKALRERPGEEDRERLRVLVNRKTAVESSGLARLDGRRDRAGGQRIGELVTGKQFPAMPSRWRVEVCVDVFLQILEEHDPTGYAEGMYGTRESWREWWLQADQGHQPEIGSRSLTVWGYLDMAFEQLTDTRNRVANLNAADEHHTTGTVEGTIELPDARAEAEGRVAAAHAQRDEALERARQVGELLDQARADAQSQTDARAEAEGRVAAAHAQRDEALERARVAGLRLRRVTMALAVAVVVTVGAVGWRVSVGPPTLTVQLASPAQEATAAQQLTFPFKPALPAGRDWTLSITVNATPTDRVSACTFNMRITAHIEVDGQALSSFTSDPSQTTITKEIHLGKHGSRGLQLVVTRLDTDPECTLRLEPAGSQATATG